MDERYLAEIEGKMIKAVAAVTADMQTIRTGRATPSLIENVRVSVYGGSQKLTLKELATITTSDAKTLLVIPFDPSITEEIVYGMAEANLGFNPQSDGHNIRIILPPLTAERREEFVKLVRAKAEGGRIMIRQIRHEAMSNFKRMVEAKEMDEDTKKRMDKKIQELTDEFVAEIDGIIERKEEEIRTV